MKSVKKAMKQSKNDHMVYLPDHVRSAVYIPVGKTTRANLTTMDMAGNRIICQIRWFE